MFISYLVMFAIPNIGFVGMFIAAFTLTYRVKALIPLYIFVMLYGLFYGLITGIPYLVVWLPLCGMFMLIGKVNLPLKLKIPVYMILCALHGLAFGTLYAPFAVLIFGIPLSFQTMLAWIIAGLPYDFAHALGNLAAGILIVPLSELLKKLDSQIMLKSASSEVSG